jgi:hypothetical protein
MFQDHVALKVELWVKGMLSALRWRKSKNFVFFFGAEVSQENDQITNPALTKEIANTGHGFKDSGFFCNAGEGDTINNIQNHSSLAFQSRGVWRGVSKGGEDGRRMPALQVGTPETA